MNDGDMQLLALTFVDKECCGLELFCDWPAALLLHWGTAESQSSPWKRMELNKMLVHVSNDAQPVQQQHRQQHKKEDSERNIQGQEKTNSGKASNTDKGDASRDSSADECHLETLYGTFGHYAIDNKAAQTLFEVLRASKVL